ncbi:HesA/MoeB/ThiF family protein [Roseovarius sp. A21]|uniref:HesA/MoeB/ThiF family protein n=1 Tax=Roseovarius bejariae TaxID=2576383 RepID=A0A844D0K2_9RHOB|nr:HesA/MoeB/ThiF family protein [Roseovarius bejariae]MRU16360.1 HesA/MoeB/ThiF family protein [Roseovarius bejariae]
MSRYARQMILPEVGAEGQARITGARVLVVGAGGLAAPALPLLAGAGVGHLTIVDADRVSLSNLHRQTLFAEEDCGTPKAVVAADRCRAINGEIKVEAVETPLTPANGPGLVAAADLVLDCADSYAVSYTLSDICMAQGVPLISASVLGLGGYAGGFCGGAPSLRALFPEAPDSGASCETAGVLGPVVGMIGAMQAQMALSVLLGLAPSPLGQLVQFDGLRFQSSSFRFDGAPEPDARFAFVAASELGAGDKIIELREDGDPLHPSAHRLAAAEVSGHLPDPGTRLALCCATGLRAWRTAEQVRQVWPGEIVLVAAAAS